MPRSRDSNTKVYKVRKDAVDMAVGYLIASSKYASTDIQVCKESAIQEFGLTNVETALAVEALINYTSHRLEHN